MTDPTDDGNAWGVVLGLVVLAIIATGLVSGFVYCVRCAWEAAG